MVLFIEQVISPVVVSGVRFQYRRRPKKTAGQIDKETLKKRMSNVEVRNSVYSIKK
jgi:hypothetical protein